MFVKKTKWAAGKAYDETRVIPHFAHIATRDPDFFYKLSRKITSIERIPMLGQGILGGDMAVFGLRGWARRQITPGGTEFGAWGLALRPCAW
jgi:hypothetical protein